MSLAALTDFLANRGSNAMCCCERPCCERLRRLVITWSYLATCDSTDINDCTYSRTVSGGGTITLINGEGLDYVEETPGVCGYFTTAALEYDLSQTEVYGGPEPPCSNGEFPDTIPIQIGLTTTGMNCDGEGMMTIFISGPGAIGDGEEVELTGYGIPKSFTVAHSGPSTGCDTSTSDFSVTVTPYDEE